MRVRPFWIEAIISGRSTKLAGGTPSKDGKHEIQISQRDNGEVVTPYMILQFTKEDENGVLKCHTRVFYLGDLISEHITDY